MAVAATLTDTQGIIAIVAAAIAVVALALAIALLVAVRRLRSAQQQVLGEEQLDLVSHAAGMQDAFEALRQYVEEVAVRLDGRLSDTETALRKAIAHRALVRYDAYNELSGRQSVSIALLTTSARGLCCPASTTAIRRGSTPSTCRTVSRSSSSLPRRQRPCASP